MFPFFRGNPVAVFLSAVFLLPASCNSLPRSGFDPSGDRLFERNCLPSLTNCEFLGQQKKAPVSVNATPVSNTAQEPGASVYSPQQNSGLPGNIGAVKTNPAVPQYVNTATPLPPNTHAVTTAVIADPQTNGKQPFQETGGYALPTVPVSGPALIVTPREQIAPIGSEVVLIASYLGNKDRLVTNEKIEWTLEGVGTLEQFDPGSACDPLFCDFTKAQKKTDRFAVTKTSQVYRTLDRGTADTTDDIHLLRGQTWVTVNSMKEGTTHVTAFAPSLKNWANRTDAGIIHWVDAQWIIPRLTTAAVGESRALTTTVLYASTGQPRKDWIVRYEILNGPAAGLGAGNAQIEEIETDAAGQATTILTPLSQSPGTNTLRISIVRPAAADTDRVTVGSEIVRQTWSGNPNVIVNIQGPASASLGTELPYKISVNNRSGQVILGTLLLPIPPNTTYVRSTPAGQLSGQTVFWSISVPPASVETVDVVVKQSTAGSLWLRPEFRRTDMVNSVPPVPPAADPPPKKNNPERSPAPDKNAAVVYPGTTPPAPVPPVNSPLTLRIEINPDSLTDGDTAQFDFYFYVGNPSDKEVRNVRLEIPLPQELRGKVLRAASSPAVPEEMPDGRFGLDVDRNTVMLDGVTIPAKGSAHIWLEYPMNDTGYNVTGEVFVNGQSAGKKSEWLKLR